MSTRNYTGTEGGMVLLLCMIFLTAMMLLGLSSSADTILQNQLAANLQTAERVKQSAQAALEAGEKWLMNLETSPPGPCQPPCKPAVIHPAGTLPGDLQHKPLAWWLAHGQAIGGQAVGKAVGKAVGQNPPAAKNKGNPSVWLIESSYTVAVAERPDERRSWYRILARASDSTDTVVSVVESIVLKTWSGKESPPSTKAAGPTFCSAVSNACERQAWRRLR